MISALYNIILSPITQIIEISYRVFSKLFSSQGIAVIGVSLTVTLLCLPLYIVAEQWQEAERRTQDRLKSGIARIKKAFSGDEQYMILSTYYRQNRYHPMMALRSSFGILIQIPFFLAAYHTLSALPDLQGRHFLFIRNMGEPDATFRIGSFSVNVLPIAMTLINCVSGFIYSRGHGIREKAQIYGMAALFLVVLYNSPAGLVLYWTMNNVFSLVKNIFYKMRHPLLVLYLIVCAGAVLTAAHILFLYPGRTSMAKRVPAAIAALLLIPVPLYLRAAEYLLLKPLSPLVRDRGLRTRLYLASALPLTILSGLVLPTSLIASSVQEFSNIDSCRNPTAFLRSSFWTSFGLMFFWPTCIFFLFKEKVQSLMAALFLFLIACALVNAFAFSGDYGSMDATLKFIDGNVKAPALQSLMNALALAAALALVLLIVRCSLAQPVQRLCLVAAAALTILSIINIRKINSEYAAYQKIAGESDFGDAEPGKKYALSRTERNIVIFMLDRFESAFVPHILNDFPALRTELDGFIHYPNTVSPNGHTLMASPCIYGGYEYLPSEMNRRKDKTLKEKHNEAILMLPTLLAENGFHSYLSDISWANYSYVSDMSFACGKDFVTAHSVMGRYSGDFKKECQKPGFEKSSLSHVLNRNLLWVSLFRISPVALRPAVYYKGTWWENGAKESSRSFADWFSALYYLAGLTSTDSAEPTLSIITNEATHSSEDTSMYNLPMDGPYSLNDNAYIIDCNVLDQIAKFLSFLKESGCYDNTKIILVSDHGIGLANHDLYTTPDINGYMKDHLNSLLMVKDFGAHGEIQTDMTFMATADVPAIALKDVAVNPENPFTGNPLSSEPKKDGILVTTADLFMPYHSKSKYEFTVPEDSWYRVRDNIFVDGNWERCATER